MLAAYSEPEDWYWVWFSNEVRFGYGSQGKLHIIRKPGERYCQNCIQKANKLDKKNKKCHHCWAAIRHNFKSNIYFYEVSTNSNGKISQKIYFNQIFKPIVQPWIKTGQNFVLEKDGNSSHGPRKSNIVRTWKKEQGLDYYFNCASIFDLSLIENYWQPPKQHFWKYFHWNNATTKKLIYEGWGHVSQSFINKKISSMLDRLQAVIDGEGKMTSY